MASSNIHAASAIRRESNNMTTPYFLFAVTNYPDLVQHMPQYNVSHQQSQQQHQRATLRPGRAVHFVTAHMEQHEILLYNTVRSQLREIIQGYLRRTRRPYSIHLIFDV